MMVTWRNGSQPRKAPTPEYEAERPVEVNDSIPVPPISQRFDQGGFPGRTTRSANTQWSVDQKVRAIKLHSPEALHHFEQRVDRLRVQLGL